MPAICDWVTPIQSKQLIVSKQFVLNGPNYTLIISPNNSGLKAVWILKIESDTLDTAKYLVAIINPKSEECSTIVIHSTAGINISQFQHLDTITNSNDPLMYMFEFKQSDIYNFHLWSTSIVKTFP